MGRGQIVLLADEAQRLKELAQRWQVTPGEALRRAIWLASWASGCLDSRRADQPAQRQEVREEVQRCGERA